jgi:hypothetical protein
MEREAISFIVIDLRSGPMPMAQHLSDIAISG